MHGRYEDVPNVLPDSTAWESSQGGRNKGVYRTIDEVEKKHQKNYDLIMNNPVNFVKTDIINKMKKVKMLQEKLKEMRESSESGSDSDSSSASGLSLIHI